jgi:hypothetical protein
VTNYQPQFWLEAVLIHKTTSKIRKNWNKLTESDWLQINPTACFIIQPRSKQQGRKGNRGSILSRNEQTRKMNHLHNHSFKWEIVCWDTYWWGSRGQSRYSGYKISETVQLFRDHRAGTQATWWSPRGRRRPSLTRRSPTGTSSSQFCSATFNWWDTRKNVRKLSRFYI